MNSTKPLKLGFIGLQGHVGTVLQGARQLGDVEVVAFADRDPKRREAFARRAAANEKPQAYEHWLQLIEHTMLDVCCVGDESGAHVEPLLALLARDIDVVCEKPLVTSLADLDRVRTALARSKSRLTMLLELRHQPKNVCVRRLIQSGAIGEVRQVAAQKSYQWGERAEWFKSRARLGGTIPYVGIHSLDTIRWTTGLEFTHVAAIHGGGRPEFGETEFQASVLGRLANGASVTARLDYLRPASLPTHGDDRLRVVGDRGLIEVNEGDDGVLLATAEKTQRVAWEPTENLFVEFARFVRGGPAPRITADDCFASTELVLRTRDAADQQTMLALPPRRPFETR